MSLAPIKMGGTYVHKRTNTVYIVTGACLAKLGNGDWVPSFIYTKRETGEVFVRDQIKFRKNFKEMEE